MLCKQLLKNEQEKREIGGLQYEGGVAKNPQNSEKAPKINLIDMVLPI
jgi:hypothetical protein